MPHVLRRKVVQRVSGSVDCTRDLRAELSKTKKKDSHDRIIHQTVN